MKPNNTLANAVENYTQFWSASGANLITPKPNPDSESILKTICHGAPPIDLRMFYTCCDGIGFIGKGDSGEIRWLVPNVDNLAQMIEGAQRWFSKDHPNLVSRFLPFMEDDGDCTGYLRNSDGSWQDCLYWFSHEDYRFDKNQQLDEFLFCYDETLIELLTSLSRAS